MLLAVHKLGKFVRVQYSKYTGIRWFASPGNNESILRYERLAILADEIKL